MMVTCPHCQSVAPATARHCPTCGALLQGTTFPLPATPRPASYATFTAASPSAPLPTGTILNGHYRIERVLGQGAFGRVYLAIDTQDPASPPLAIKELLDKPFAAPDDKREAIAWFKREVSTLLSLDHAGIPAIYGYWTAHAAAGPFYLAMEYISGKTLQQVQADLGGQAPWQTVVGWGLGLCEVLAYLHGQTPPVVFRDLKPPNVMLDDRTNRPVLIDFGIARQLAQGSGTTIGTPGYAPYEQWLGQAEPRSDVYALGALLHALLTGRNPESEYTRLQRAGLDVASALQALFPAVETLVPGVPAELGAVLRRATAFAKEDRYPSATALAAALQHVLHPAATMRASLPSTQPVAPAIPPTVVNPPGPVYTAPAPTTAPLPAAGGAGRRMRRSALVGLIGAVLLIGGAAGIMATRVLGQPAPRRVAAKVRVPAPTPTRVTVRTRVIVVTATPAPTQPPVPTQPPTPTQTPYTRVLGVRSVHKTARHAHPAATHRSAHHAATRRTPAHRQARVQSQHPSRPVALYVSTLHGGATGAHLRSAPTTTSAVLMLILDGTRVQAAPRLVKGSGGQLWQHVTYRGHSGYILHSLLIPHKPAPLPVAYVAAGVDGYTGVNVRAQPSMSAPILTGANNGATVRVIGQPVGGDNGEDWDHVLVGRTIGYARAKLLSSTPRAPVPMRYVAAAQDGYTGVVVRAQPSLSADEVVGIDNGGYLFVTGPPVMGDNGEQWDPVAYQDQLGFARAKLLSNSKPAPTPEMYVNAAGYGYTGVDVRTDPSVNADTLIEAPNGVRIFIVGQQVTGDNGEQWDQVAYQDKTGWVRDKLLSFQPPS